MVIGEKDDMTTQPTATQMMPPPASIDNIMSGISNTGAVKMNNHRKKLRQRFDLIKKLGQGTYGKVQLGINKETSQDVAIKTIKKCKIETEADLVRIRREVQIMSSVQHPNIIHIYEVFENREKMVLVMEFAAGGELYDYLSERKVLTEDEARRIFRQIATAVYYCHKHKICHRDLKLENILLDENGNAKIADFGLSNVFDDKRLLATFCGSPLYASPEIVKGTPYQGPEVDCWSLGVLLYTLVYGAMPFDGSNFKRLVKQISAGDYYEPKKPSNASPLIREMLTVCPKRRATIEQICNHWWVNEGYQSSCLDLAEQLANQTPVRLDVLLSLAPSAVTSDQLVVPNPNENDGKQTVSRSMSVGSIRDIADIANTEAERRIIDMVAAGGEAALAPSPTRTITPSASVALQVKRKPETTISTESMIGGTSAGARKRDKPTEQIKGTQSKLSISEYEPAMAAMEVDENQAATTGNEVQTEKSIELSSSTLPEVPNEKVANESNDKPTANKNVDTKIEELPPTKLSHSTTGETKPVMNKFAKTKTADIGEIAQEQSSPQSETIPNDSAIKPSGERRRSRILETAEKFEAASTVSDKLKKIGVPATGKKEHERKISLPTVSTSPTAEKPKIEKPVNDANKIVGKEECSSANSSGTKLVQSDSKGSNLSLEEARRSMENSIALLNQAKAESINDVDQLCAKTENVAVSTDDEGERQKKLKAREIIGNAIPRLSGMGIRKPPVPFGAHGRSISGSVVPSATAGSPTPRNISTPPDSRMHERESPLSIYNSRPTAVAVPPDQEPIDEEQPMKVSTAEITLKSATLPRRKIDSPKFSAAKEPSNMPRFSNEMRSAPIRENQYQSPFNSAFAPTSARSTSLEPQQQQQQQQQKPKEHYIPIQRIGGYVANPSSSQRSMLSRQSTNDSDTTSETASTTTIGAQSSLQTSNSSQPIKKSPREFIIPIAVEGGGFVTPRAGSLEPSESSNSTSTAFSRFGRPRKISSIFNDSEDESTTSPFHRMQRHTSIGRDSDTETDPNPTRFTYRLRSTRPIKKLQTTEGNDSGSSGEEDDEDGFEILTAENLFSTLLSRVRALTNRLNVKDDPISDFPSTRFMSNLRQSHSPFWGHHDPFASSKQYSYYSESVVTTKRQIRLNSSGAWRHSMSRDIGTDIDSMFSSRTGATLPRGAKCNTNTENQKPKKSQANDENSKSSSSSSSNATANGAENQSPTQIDNNNQTKKTCNETLDLADLDLSQLRLTKKDLETLSTITPNLPKHFQEQLLAQLPPNQAKKLSRTLSMQGTAHPPHVYKRSLSSGREIPEKSGAASIPKTPTLFEDEKQTNENPFDRNSILRRSISRSRDASAHRRSTSGIRSELPSRLSYTGDLRSDYNASKPNDSLTGRYRLNEYTSALPPSSMRSDYYSKLPTPANSSSISPQKSPSNDALESPVRRRSSQRGISRFLRSDFYDNSANANDTNENSLTKAKRERERETQSVLREIRERSRDRARLDSCPNVDQTANNSSRYGEPLSNGDSVSSHKEHRRKSSIPNIRITVDKQNGRIYHARNKSVERCCDIEGDDDTLRDSVQNRGTLSIGRAAGRASSVAKELKKQNEQSAADFTEEILNELVQRSLEHRSKADSVEKSEPKVDGDTIKKTKTKTKDGKKVKTKPKSTEKLDKQFSTADSNSKSITDLPNDVESVTLPLPMSRRKSYTNKEGDDKVTAVPVDKVEMIENGNERLINSGDVSIDITLRPKSYPNSKLTPPKEIVLKPTKKSSATQSSSSNGGTRNAITAVMEKLMEKSAERLSPAKSTSPVKAKSEGVETSPPKTVKKKVKVVKKVSKSDQSSPTKEASPRRTDDTSNETSPVKERKSPEKKLKSGFLYTIGQKFEKMRESSKNKDKEKKLLKSNETLNENASKSVEPIEVPVDTKPIDTVESIVTARKIKEKEELKPIPQMAEISIRKIELQPILNANAATKADQRKSRIDAMIRTLRERSVPHTIRAENQFEAELGTESGLIKRAVSVEDIPNGVTNFHKCNVNKVLGLFRRIEREQQLQKQQQQLQFSAIGNVAGGQDTKERPKSGGFVSKLKKTGRPYYTGAKSDTIITLTDQLEKQYLSEKANQAFSANNTKIPLLRSSFNAKIDKSANCSDCYTNDFKDTSPAVVERKRSASHTPDSKFFNASKTPDPVIKQQIPNFKIDGNNEAIASEKERIRNNRKGLVLDLNNDQFDISSFSVKKLTNNNNNNHIVNGTNDNHQYQYNGNGNSYGAQSTQCNGFNGVNNNYGGKSTNNNNNNYNFNGHSDRNSGTSFDLSTNYSSDNRSTRDDCESTSTFLSPTEEPELCFDDWSACSGSTDDHIQKSPHAKHLNYSGLRNNYQPSEPNQNLSSSAHEAASTPSDSESVIDRIKRRSFYCRFNEKKPKRTSSIVGTAAQRDYYRDAVGRSKSRTADYMPTATNGCQMENDHAYHRNSSKSPTPMISTLVNSSSNANDLSARAISPSYSTNDENEDTKTQSQLPHYHYHYHPHVHQRSQTPSRPSSKTPFESDDRVKVKSNDYLNLRSTLTSPPALHNPRFYSHPMPATTPKSPSSLPTIDYHSNGNHRPYSMRNSIYDSLTPSASSSSAASSSTSPFIYGTYNPKRRLSTSYLAPSIAAANSSNGYSDHMNSSCYATLGRTKPRSYDHRSISMLDSSALPQSSALSLSKRYGDHQYSHSHYRPLHDYTHFNSRSSLRSPPVSHSPTSNV